ncbi:hypothetical protein V8G57_22810 [Collimonas sp. H4R21]|uniref:Uncharacterized protein n=1 Tax=Collimonas rhizosphaerae TaxID=3126357 RepID=A0ABU9Q1Y3_9BURK
METSPSTNVRRLISPGARDRLISPGESDRIAFALGFDGAQVQTKNPAVAMAFLFAIEIVMCVGEICAMLPENVTGRVARH